VRDRLIVVEEWILQTLRRDEVGRRRRSFGAVQLSRERVECLQGWPTRSQKVRATGSIIRGTKTLQPKALTRRKSARLISVKHVASHVALQTSQLE